jgi:biotin carboxylase
MSDWFVVVESNTTGSGRLFCAAARHLGLQPVMFTRDPSRYPYLTVDRIPFRVVDTADPRALLRAGAGLGGRIAGVTSSSEYSVGIAGEVARALGLPHQDPAAVTLCRDKNRQRTRLSEAGLPGPRFAAVRMAGEAVVAAAAIGFPVVVKPVAGSGSIGVRLCATADEVREAADHVLCTDHQALALPPQQAVLVEEYLRGREYSVEVLGTEVVGVTRKHLGPVPYFVEIGHDFPAPLPGRERRVLADTAIAALRALGLGHGPAHVELRLTAAGPRVVEVNPRLAGGMIPRLVQEAYGVDMILQTVAGAVGGFAGGPASTQPTEAAAAIRFLVPKVTGRLARVSGAEEVGRLPGVVEVVLNCHVGQDVVPGRSFRDRLGFVIATAETAETAAARAVAALAGLTVEIAPARDDSAARPKSLDRRGP